jgi:winged helix-turn helix protein
MSKPLVIRPLTDEERCTFETGLRSSDAFTLRRCQILLASADGGTSSSISRQLRCGQQTVRNVLRAFNAHRLAVLTKGSTVAHHLPHTAFDAAGLEHLKVIIKRSPRTFGKPTSIWTLDLLAEVCFAEGLTPRQVSGETIRTTLKRLDIAWKRAKRWIKSPDPDYTPKKSVVTA